MNLRALIPDAAALNGPFAAIVGGSGGGGLAGLADRISSQDLAGSAASLAGLFEERLAAALPAAGGLPFDTALGTFSSLSRVSASPPTDLLAGLQGPLGEIGGIVSRLPPIVASFGDAARGIQAAQHGDLAPLVGQAGEGLLRAVQAATGPDLAGFDEWRRYLVDLVALLRPLVEAGGTPEAVRQRLLDLAIGRIRDTILGLAPEVSGLGAGAAAFFQGLLPDVPGLGLPALRDAVTGRLGDLRAAAEADRADLSAEITAFGTALHTLTDTLHRALDEIEARLDSPLLTPGGLAAAAGREIDRVLATQVDDFSDVMQRVEEFFTRIETAVDTVDLSVVRGGIEGFFTRIREAMGGLDPAAVEGEIDRAAATVDENLDRLEETMTALTARVQAWLAELSGGLEGGIGALGATGPDGRFHFRFETEVEALYGRIDALIQGDPARPDDFSVRKALEDFQNAFAGLIAEIEGALTGLADQLVAARDQVAASLGGVRQQIAEVDPQSVMDQANAALEEAFDRIGSLDFDVVVDPVVEELGRARDQLAQIDVSSLNEMLRAALAAALDGVLQIDFEVDITGALLGEVDALLAGPRQLLHGIGEKVDALVHRVTEISPEALLAPLQEQLDRLTAALRVDVRALLQPLVAVTDQLLAQVRTLDPTRFLAPLATAFGALTAAVDDLEPAALLRPAQQEIDRLAAAVRGLDLGPALAPVRAVFGDLDRFLAGLDPAVLVRPLQEPFDALTRTLESLRPAVLLAPVADVMHQLDGLTDAIPESVITTIRQLFDEAVARADSLDPGALFAAVGGLLTAFRARFDLLRPSALLLPLQQSFLAARGAVSAADGRHNATFSVRLDAAAPTLAFGAVIGRWERLAARLDAVAAGLDPAPLAAGYREVRARLEALLPRAIRDDMTAGRLRALLGLMDPARWIARLDTLYERLLGKVGQLAPAALIAPLADFYRALRETLAAVDVGRVLERIEHVTGRLGDLVGAIRLETVFAPVLAQVERLKGMVRALDPAPLIQGLGRRFEDLLALFARLGPQGLIDRLQEAWSRLAARIGELFDLSALAAPLLDVFAALRDLLGGLSAGPLIATIDARLDALRAQLEAALRRTAAAFREMLAAVPLHGSAGASVSVGGSLG